MDTDGHEFVNAKTPRRGDRTAKHTNYLKHIRPALRVTKLLVIGLKWNKQIPLAIGIDCENV
jgi:hypothetical protein